MIDFSFYFLSAASISAILLGICVSLRNNAFSGLLHPKMADFKVRDEDYGDVLIRSGKYATFSGFFFVASTVWGAGSFLLSHSYLMGMDNYLWYLTVGNTGLFIIGILLLGYALVFDYITIERPIHFDVQLEWPPIRFTPPEQDTERPDTEPVDESEGGEEE